MTLEELVRLFGDGNMAALGEGLAAVGAEGAGAVLRLVEILRHPAANVHARSWAMYAMPREPDVLVEVRPALLERLGDASPTVRRAAIKVSVALKDVSAREAIERLVDDDALDPSAWLDDDATVAQAARAALRELAGSRS